MIDLAASPKGNCLPVPLMTGLGHFFVSAHKEGPPAGPARGAPEIRSTSRNDLVRSAIKDGYTTRGA